MIEVIINKLKIIDILEEARVLLIILLLELELEIIIVIIDR
jgi:hypothetical protein